MGAQRCIVPHCKTVKGRKNENCNFKISMHDFPSDLNIRIAWRNRLEAIFNETFEFTDTGTHYICALHFKASDFRTSVITHLKTNDLKRGAVPSIFKVPPSHLASSGHIAKIGPEFKLYKPEAEFKLHKPAPKEGTSSSDEQTAASNLEMLVESGCNAITPSCPGTEYSKKEATTKETAKNSKSRPRFKPYQLSPRKPVKDSSGQEICAEATDSEIPAEYIWDSISHPDHQYTNFDNSFSFSGASAEEILKETPTKEIVEETPTKEIVKETPTKEIVKETPTKEIVRETPTKIGSFLSRHLTEIKQSGVTVSNKVASTSGEQNLVLSLSTSPESVAEVPFNRSSVVSENKNAHTRRNNEAKVSSTFGDKTVVFSLLTLPETDTAVQRDRSSVMSKDIHTQTKVTGSFLSQQKKELDRLKRLLVVRNQKIQSLKATVEEKEERISSLEGRISSLESNKFARNIEKMQFLANEGYADNQVEFSLAQVLNFKKKVPRWSDTVLRECVLLQASLPEAYEALLNKNLFLLPSLRTLQRFLDQKPTKG